MRAHKVWLFLAALLVGIAVTAAIITKSSRVQISTNALPLPSPPAETRKLVEGLLSPGEELLRVVQGETINASLTNRHAGYRASIHITSNQNQGWQIKDTEIYMSQPQRLEDGELRASGHLSREDIRSIIDAAHKPIESE